MTLPLLFHYIDTYSCYNSSGGLVFGNDTFGSLSFGMGNEKSSPQFLSQHSVSVKDREWGAAYKSASVKSPCI